MPHKKTMFWCLLLVVLLGASIGGCVNTFLERGGGRYDKRAISIQTLSLFSQRAQSRLSNASWKGQWLFRRSRLELIDANLRKIRPDLIFFQELMKETDSPTRSDVVILSAGALSDYSWREVAIRDFADTEETEFLSIAVGTAIDAGLAAATPRQEKLCKLGSGGGIYASSVESEGSGIYLFDVNVSKETENSSELFSVLQDCIISYLKEVHGCPKRVIIAGFLPVQEKGKEFNHFLSYLQLKDAAVEFCSTPSQCHTATSLNEIFLATSGDITPNRYDRILVHDSAYVYSSTRNFDVGSDRDPEGAKRFGLTKFWPTERFGWLASIRFSKCDSDEIIK